MFLNKQISWGLYLTIVSLCVLIGAIPSLSVNLWSGRDAMFRCDPFGLKGNNYISYCDARAFTEYDLGAHYFGLEPQAIEGLQKAEIIFFGNSRTGHSFSTDATVEAMRKLGVKNYYVAGFGYDGSSQIAQLLFQKYHLHPKVIILNADPFFTNDNAPILNALTSGRQSVYFDYLTKKYFQRIQWYICSVYNFGCGTRPTVYRKFENGFWEVKRFEERVRVSRPVVPIVEPNTYSVELEQKTEDFAKIFLNAVSLKPSCVIVTSIPSPGSMRRIAKTVAERMGLSFFQPEIGILRTYDNSHMTIEDSERWSKAMLAEAHDTISACIK